METSTKRRAFMMSVDPEKQEEYELKIKPVPLELRQAMKEHGVIDYIIYLDSSSGLLFGHLEYTSEQGLMNLTATQACMDWWKETSAFMPSNPDHSPIATDLKEVFHLD